jgi:hypothetical protein
MTATITARVACSQQRRDDSASIFVGPNIKDGDAALIEQRPQRLASAAYQPSEQEPAA